MLNKALIGLILLSASRPAFTQAPVPTTGSPTYRIVPSDQLQLTYRYTAELNENVTVLPDGTIVVKQVGVVPVGGLTTEEVRTKLLERLRTRLNDPDLAVTLSDYVKPNYVVVGEVKNPGRFDMHGDIFPADAVAMAGGFRETSAYTNVILFHMSNGTTTRLDMKSLRDPKHPRMNEVKLEPGDMLVVSKNKISKVSDYVHWVGVGASIPVNP